MKMICICMCNIGETDVDSYILKIFLLNDSAELKTDLVYQRNNVKNGKNRMGGIHIYKYTTTF